MSKNGVVTPATEAEVPTGEPGPKTNGEHMEAGMDCNIKKLYSGKEDKRGRFQWQTTPPEDVKDPVENSETAKYALLVRNTKVYNNPRKTMAIHSIVVQSPFLKKLLQNVLRDYPGITVNLRRLELAGKFEPLIHRWGRLKEAISKLGDETEEEIETKRHADLLFDVLATEFKDLIDSSQDMMSKGVMTFEYLWTIFQPGALVYTRQDGQDTALKLVSAKYGMDSNGVPVLWLSGKYVDWDGSRFGTNKINIKIGQYAGTRKIAALNALPLEYHPDREALRERLDARGKRVEELAGSYYRQYHGVGWKLSPFGGKDKYNIKGRVVIDTYGWNRFNPNNAIFVSALTAKDPQAMQIGENAESLGDDGYEDDMDADDGGMPIDGHFLDEDDASKRMPLSVEQRVICTPLIRGYSLKTKLWLNFFVNSVSDITWNKGAFDRLVLPAQQKELILGFTESQKSYKDGFDDIIEGKGRGMILLLCGPPGVGKTLTAESVAEEMQVPLYMMSAGDLGLDPRTVETSLKDILEMCTKWNAILLLDEADVFLEQRSLHELERNKLVSIFLRVLEYYEGIMFLTTNRVNTFDAAFQSRIHISLDYPELSIESRRTVWSNFLTASNVEHTISTGQLNELARMSMNGRQIKNVLKTAQLLARRKNAKLGHEHITAVLDCTQHLHNSTRETERTRSAIFC
ncbi:P-loop containing nucleoside triphosphate hydrolase protein [Trichodelitschia bisporula]|uniref:P-loop containing nucleoside triphosphate hydrolase protein n=1 Tax=Trichodelitschia bisporula TaxID=703511 RepID=A0A6G1I733_9PEZI|nr:P-loop containing nucleoside triphosphate hydrolase protein [Trichodelitschia bisporula]